MNTKEAQSLLRTQLAANFESWGFVFASKKNATWRKPMQPSGYLFVRVYMGVHARDRFRIELNAGPTHLISQTEPGLDDSYGRFLTAEDKALLLRLANRARRDIRLLREHDRWSSDDLPFDRPEHILAYAGILRDILPRIINDYVALHHLPVEPLPL